jgi:hypothetical protein
LLFSGTITIVPIGRYIRTTRNLLKEKIILEKIYTLGLIAAMIFLVLVYLLFRQKGKKDEPEIDVESTLVRQYNDVSIYTSAGLLASYTDTTVELVDEALVLLIESGGRYMHGFYPIDGAIVVCTGITGYKVTVVTTGLHRVRLLVGGLPIFDQLMGCIYADDANKPILQGSLSDGSPITIFVGESVTTWIEEVKPN